MIIAGQRPLALPVSGHLCYFLEAVLPINFHVSEFEKYNGKGWPISHLRAYYGDLAQLQADNRLLIRLF